MKCKISDTSYVINFMDTENSLNEIIQSLETQYNSILSSVKVENLEDWKICFKVIYNNVKSILIYKGSYSYPNEKYKEIVIHIPIPTLSKVPWGVYQTQFIQDITHLDKKIKNFESINVTFENFASMEEYLINSIKNAIDYILKTGFIISGHRVKI